VSSSPIVFAVISADLVTLVLLAGACRVAVEVLLGEDGSASSARQLDLEQRAESAGSSMKLAMVSALVAACLVVAAVTLVLPAEVRGAMCGAGVMEGTDGLGGRALLLRCVGLLSLVMSRTVDGLDLAQERSLLRATRARLVLLAAPILALAAFETARALLMTSPESPVDCCSVVYDLVDPAKITLATLRLGPAGVLGFTFAGLAVLALALLGGFSCRGGRSVCGALAITALAWPLPAGLVLVTDLSPYHFGVLSHLCPYCLFSAHHGFVGFALFGALGLVLAEGVAAATALLLLRRHPSLSTAVEKRVRTAARRVAIGASVIIFIGAGPALWYRFAQGVWMG